MQLDEFQVLAQARTPHARTARGGSSARSELAIDTKADFQNEENMKPCVRAAEGR